MIQKNKNQLNNMWVITTYFNPLKYQTRRKNFDIFYDKLKKQGANLILVELIQDGVESGIQLHGNDLHIKVQSNKYHIIWQKHTLLNIGIEHLPISCKYVTLMDCDIVIMDNDWIKHTINKLQKSIIVQLFDFVYYANKDLSVDLNTYNEGFFYYYNTTGTIENIKHVGYAWAFRKDFFKNIKMFQKLVLGGTDTILLHSCVRNMALKENKSRTAFARGYDKKIRDYAFSWGAKVYQLVKGNVGHTRNSIIHLWHGDIKNRNYNSRGSIVRESGFDIDNDVFINNDGIWEWKDITIPAYTAIYNHLVNRKEDG